MKESLQALQNILKELNEKLNEEKAHRASVEESAVRFISQGNCSAANMVLESLDDNRLLKIYELIREVEIEIKKMEAENGYSKKTVSRSEACKAMEIHRRNGGVWVEGDVKEYWEDVNGNLCVRYDSGRWWHYKDLDSPFPTWW
jgi:hypothetical protein